MSSCGGSWKYRSWIDISFAGEECIQLWLLISLALSKLLPWRVPLVLSAWAVKLRPNATFSFFAKEKMAQTDRSCQLDCMLIRLRSIAVTWESIDRNPIRSMYVRGSVFQHRMPVPSSCQLQFLSPTSHLFLEGRLELRHLKLIYNLLVPICQDRRLSRLINMGYCKILLGIRITRILDYKMTLDRRCPTNGVEWQLHLCFFFP